MEGVDNVSKIVKLGRLENNFVLIGNFFGVQVYYEIMRFEPQVIRYVLYVQCIQSINLSVETSRSIRLMYIQSLINPVSIHIHIYIYIYMKGKVNMKGCVHESHYREEFPKISIRRSLPFCQKKGSGDFVIVIRGEQFICRSRCRGACRWCLGRGRRRWRQRAQ